MEQPKAQEAAPPADGEDDEHEWPSGEREWSFLGGRLVVRAYEDFLAAAIGGVVTAASGELARFVAEAVPEGHWRGRRCIELGSGCGLVSSTVMQLGAHAVATDLEPFLDHLRCNLELNTPREADAGSFSCQTYDWGDEEMRTQLRAELGVNGADAVFAANCIYDRAVIPLFLEAIAAVAGPDTLAFMCGVPLPPAVVSAESAGDPACQSLLDAFLEAAPERFDCHLLASAPQPAEPPAAPESGAAAELAAEHGLTVGVLADGVWLLLPHGAAPPAWTTPMLQLRGRA